jgi:pimeloyl-ACP methyl ester carboxylesterase
VAAPAATPLHIAVPDEALDDLHERLGRAKLAPSFPGDGWTFGTSAAFLAELVAYWRHHFDWRAQEASMNAYQHHAVVLDGVRLHYLRAPGVGTAPLPIVLTHGWPWTFWDFRRVIGPLSDPAAHGGDPADSFDVVVPSLPGFGFSAPLERPGTNFSDTADLWVRLMTEVLGFERFGAHGCDWGMFVSAQLGHKYPERTVGVHLSGPPRLDGWTVTPAYHPWSDYLRGAQATTDPSALSAYLAWERNRVAHLAVHIGDPQSLAHGLHDSPVALASWLVNRRYAWSDCGGDITSRFSMDELITGVALYWFTDTASSSIRFYRAAVDHPWQPSHDRRPVVGVPTGITMFRPDRPPGYDPGRVDLSGLFNLTFERMHERGGHFVPVEEPERLVTDLRDFFRPLRAGV